jgi:hypothetical protein
LIAGVAIGLRDVFVGEVGCGRPTSKSVVGLLDEAAFEEIFGLTHLNSSCGAAAAASARPTAKPTRFRLSLL